MADQKSRAGRFRLLGLGLCGFLLFTVTCAVAIGPVSIPFADVWTVIATTVFQGQSENAATTSTIVWEIRLPRVVLGALVGAGLSVTGATIQGMVRNPLADPYIIGVSSGAAVGAILILVVGISVGTSLVAPAVGAFCGALLTSLVVFRLAKGKYSELPPIRLILIGIAVSYALSGVTSFFLYASNDQGLVNEVLFWVLGGLTRASWGRLLVPAVGVGLGVGLLLRYGRTLNALTLGDDLARSLGINPGRARRILFVYMSLLVGVIVASAGQIAFVGLIMPHMARLLVGSNNVRVLVVSALLGASFLVWVDVVARMIFAPTEVPIGVFTSIVGAPVFVWLLLYRAREIGVGV